MTMRLLRLAAGFAVAVLIVGVACSNDEDDNAADTDITATSAGERGAAEPAATSSAPGTASGTPGTGPPASNASGAGTPVAGTAGATTTPVAATAGRATTATPGTTTVTLRANLTGEAEVPDPGIAGGTGVAMLKITGMQMCYTLNAPIAEKPIVAHIHEGAAGEAGDIVINFEVVFERTPSAFVAEKCLNKDPELLAGIIANPAGFYVNIHTGEHPRGALRGQLEASS